MVSLLSLGPGLAVKFYGFLSGLGLGNGLVTLRFWVGFTQAYAEIKMLLFVH